MRHPFAKRSRVTEGRPRPWSRRFRRIAVSFLTSLLVAYLAVWWVSLRIVVHPSWPPPADAVPPDQSQAFTESFLQRDGLTRDDVGIDFAPATASTVQLFLDGPQFFPAMLADIVGAQHSIHLVMFGMTEGEIAQRFTDSLTARAKAGVEVRVILDAYGAKVTGESKGYIEQMTAAGVQVVANHEFPLDRDGLIGAESIDWLSDEIGEADHRKTMVIDGEIGWVGGAGFQDHFNGGRFLDTFTRFEGDIVLQLQCVFFASFAVLGGPDPASPNLGPYFPAPAMPGTIRATLLQNVSGGFKAGTQASQFIIESATTRLDILNPYFTDHGMIDRIVDAARRGVQVRIVSSQHTNNEPADHAFNAQIERLEAAGVEVYKHPRVVHAKVTVADGNLIIGTFNYDAWALYRNLEIGVLFEDAALADQAIAALVGPVVAESTRAEAPDGTIEKARTWFWDKLTYFL